MSGISIDDLSLSAGFFPDIRFSRTVVPCISCIASAGHMVACVVMDQMVGDRRSPGRQYWGSRPSTSSANHRFPVPSTGSVHRDGSFFLFWDFGSLHLKASRRPSGQVLRQRQSQRKTLRRPERPTQLYRRCGVTMPAVCISAMMLRRP